MQKVPCDEHGRSVDATDPRYWCSWDVAAARGWGVAVVMGTIDPVTGLRVSSVDLDDAWDSAGQLRPIAAEAWNALAGAGAYAERSVSGRGIHFIGLSDLPEGHAVKRKTAPGLEVYSERRTLILGDYLGGDGRVNISEPLRGLMQRHGLPLVVERAEIEEGRADRWLGPEDDDELLRVMLGQGLRGGRMFEDSAVSVAQLWNLDVPALAKRYPAQGRPDKRDYDASAVDAAMMAELSYFTGRDQPRMVRLFERWPGYRPEKYQGKGEYRLSRVLSIGVRNERVYRNERYAAPVTALAPMGSPAAEAPKGVLGEYLAYLPDHTFYHRPSGKYHQAVTVDARVPPVVVGTKPGGVGEVTVKASKWLAQNQPIFDRTWAPGLPEVIEGYVLRGGVWREAPGMRVINTYRPPLPPQPRGVDISPWLDHVRRIYPGEAEQLFDWMAFVAQNPTIKVNWAIVLGGAQGIGKDFLLEPLRRVVDGFGNAAPETIIKSEFNPYLKTRVLIINEAKDTGGENRYQFYEKTKTIITAPPNVHVINEKRERPYEIPNLNATVITTNHRSGGMYLPADDRRHFVTFSNCVKADFTNAYWDEKWAWMNGGAVEDCAAWLMARDVSRFNAKIPPAPTAAFLEMVEGGQSEDHGPLDDITDGLTTFSLAELSMRARDLNDVRLANWLSESGKVGRSINKILLELGFVVVRNPLEVKGRWLLNKRRVIFYGRQSVPMDQLIAEVRKRMY